jgi:hypothetical protein
MNSSELAYVDPERRALADLMWTDDHGDRHTSMTILVCGADAGEIQVALHGALLSDDEMVTPHEWPHYPDPLGEWHQDPCHELTASDADDADDGLIDRRPSES